MSEHLATLIDWRKGDNVTTEAFNAAVDAAIAALSGLGEYAACCDTPHYCSSERRCTRLDTHQPVTPAGGEDDEELAARMDARLYGRGFIVNGKRVAPERVQLITHPPAADAALVRELVAACNGAEHLWTAWDSEHTYKIERAKKALAALNQRGGVDHG